MWEHPGVMVLVGAHAFLPPFREAARTAPAGSAPQVGRGRGERVCRVVVVVVLGTSLSRASDSVPVLRERVSVWWECVLLL